MSHPRQDIRAHVAARLAAWPTAAGQRVFPSRAVGLEMAAQPAMAIYDDEERVSDPGSDRPRRELTLKVEIYANAADPVTLDAELDAMAWAVEAAMDQDPRLGGLAIGVGYTGMIKARDAQGQLHVGCLTMSFVVEYSARLPEPEAPDFLLYHGEYPNYPGAVDEVHMEPPA